MLSVGDAIGGSLVGATDKLKESMKTILTLMLDTLQAELLAADAAMAIRALFTSGISLTTDLALAALAYGGVEIAKGAINSFAIGSPYIPQNQLAFVHKGERVMTERENKEYTSSQSPQRNKSFMLGPKTNRMRGQVSVSVDTFGRATDYNDFQMQESVF